GDPRHHLRVGEVPGLAANLPHARVGLFPARLEESKQRALERPRLAVAVHVGLSRLVHRVEELAVHVELELVHGRVADADRLRALVAAEPGDLYLPEPSFARGTVQDLELRRVAGDGTHEPFAPRLGLGA